MGLMTGWFHNLRAAARKREFDEGYDYAAGALLRGADESELVMDFDDPWHKTDFDRGGLQAMRDWRARGLVNGLGLPLEIPA